MLKEGLVLLLTTAATSQAFSTFEHNFEYIPHKFSYPSSELERIGTLNTDLNYLTNSIYVLETFEVGGLPFEELKKLTPRQLFQRSFDQLDFSIHVLEKPTLEDKFEEEVAPYVPDILDFAENSVLYAEDFLPDGTLTNYKLSIDDFKIRLDLDKGWIIDYIVLSGISDRHKISLVDNHILLGREAKLRLTGYVSKDDDGIFLTYSVRLEDIRNIFNMKPRLEYHEPRNTYANY